MQQKLSCMHKQRAHQDLFLCQPENEAVYGGMNVSEWDQTRIGNETLLTSAGSSGGAPKTTKFP